MLRHVLLEPEVEIKVCNFSSKWEICNIIYPHWFMKNKIKNKATIYNNGETHQENFETWLIKDLLSK